MGTGLAAPQWCTQWCGVLGVQRRRWGAKVTGPTDPDRAETGARTVRVGADVGPYRVEGVIARGGMSVVYRARDRRLDRQVALKILDTDPGSSAELRERFLREARFAAAIDHPHIVPIYDAGEAGDLLYIAMRWVQGGTLDDWIDRRGPLGAAGTVDLLAPVAAALDLAHAGGLVHRDVKPSNILLNAQPDTDGPVHVYLTDFGVSRIATARTGLTSIGTVIGTVSYMAPEQITGRRIDARTDLYALACVAYECLTGAPPFVREDQAALLWAQVNEQPVALSAHRPDLRAADRVLARAMAKEPADRYRSCAQFIAALDASFAEHRSPVAATGDTGTTTTAGTTTAASGRGRSERGRPHGASPEFTTDQPAPTVRVFLVDDHELVRKGVADLLGEAGDLTVIGQAPSVAQALAAIPRAAPDVAVLDIHLPDGNGIELCRELRDRMPDLRCLMLTALNDEQAMLTAILAGASGYAVKDITGTELVTAVRTVGAGRTLADSRTVEALIGRLRADAEPSGKLAALTPRERTVLTLIAEGLTNRQIGERMSLAENTVKNYVAHVLDKLGVSGRRQAAELLHRLGRSR